MLGQPASSARSPITVTGWSRATRRQISGPMPAGSPEVRAMRGLFLVKRQLDVGRVAKLAQPFLVRLLRLALAQRLARLQAAALRRRFAGAPLDHLDQVVAEGRAHRLADLADL